MRTLRLIFTLTIFLSAGLVFLVQPMVAKMILPVFGGSPAVWNTAMLFFQALLLLGYGYAHLASRYLGPKRHAGIHLALLAAVLLTLPFALPKGFEPPATANPSLAVLMVLGLMAGPGFFIISAGAPLLQSWFARTNDPQAKDPYFLYAASNLGSLIALLGYPIWVEPGLKLRDQSGLWMGLYVALIVGMGLCAWLLWKSPPPEASEDLAEEATAELPIVWKQRLHWIALAAAPSSLMLGATTYLTTNLSPVPLLWIVPLSLYLLTFVIAFAKKQVIPVKWISFALPLVALPLVWSMLSHVTQPLLLLAVLHLVTFFLAAWSCHGYLAELRPSAKHLTEFYFWLSVGGVVGGIFNALLAPVIFKTIWEYPIALFAACLLRKPAEIKPGRPYLDLASVFIVAGLALLGAVIADRAELRGNAYLAVALGFPALATFLFMDFPVRFGLALAAMYTTVTLHSDMSRVNPYVHRGRSFFGPHWVYNEDGGKVRSLAHGNTVHGSQFTDPEKALTPTTYYVRQGPIGQVFENVVRPMNWRDIAVVGLGTGGLASYGRKQDHFTFFEIDPEIVKVAQNPELFTYLSRTPATVEIVLGDARLTLNKQPDEKFDLLVLDAFSSDAIPMHLLTREALSMYLKKIRPSGILAVHISNRYLNLKPPLAVASRELGVPAIDQIFTVLPMARITDFATGSEWVVFCRDPKVMEMLRKTGLWVSLSPPANFPVWTDDYSNILSVLNLR